jgi:hypothetical protein
MSLLRERSARPTLTAALIPSPRVVDEFVNLVDDIVAAQCQLVISYLDLVTPSVVRRPAPAEPPAPVEAPTEASTPLQAGAPDPDVPDESIRAKAYELYLRRGRTPGNDLEDWQRAKNELQAATAGPAS